MTKEEMTARLENVASTIRKLDNPDILSVSIMHSYGRGFAAVHVYDSEKQPSEVFCGIEGELKVDREFGAGIDRYVVVDVNGVEVFCLKESAASEVSFSEAAKSEADRVSGITVIIDANTRFVKEEDV